MKKYLSLAVASIAGTLLFAGCTDDYDSNDENVYQKDTIVFDLTVSGVVSRADSPGEDYYNENKISKVDIFLFDQNADGTAEAAVLHEQAELSSSTSENAAVTRASISYANLKEALENGEKKYTVIAIANYNEAISLEDLPTLKKLKETTVANQKFRSGTKQDSFVMTSFDNPLEVTLSNDSDEVNGGTIKLRRVAAKIRMAINVAKSIAISADDTWYPDLKNMRLYISNGVKKARLDGKISTKEDGTLLTLGDDDYFSILTQGGSNNDDYNFARQFSTATSVTDDVKDDYPYYNALPYYTYPNEWSDGVTESHQTMLTIVIPWKDKEKDETTYKPTYYVVPLNNDNKIVSNAYYYLRANINMMGSESPAKPMEVEMQCEIADWGTADDTDVSLRPLRFLIFNNSEFNIYNENSITIPFSSTHPCKVESFEGKFYRFVQTYSASTPNAGDAVAKYFNEKTLNSEIPGSNKSIFGKERFYYYEIDNTNNTLTFTHDFFNIWEVTESNNQATYINGPYKRQNNSQHKLYSQVDITLKVRHDTGQDTDKGYEETIILHFFPSLYVTTEYVDKNDSPLFEGWLFINGYHLSQTGNLGSISQNDPDRSDTRSLTTITATNLDEQESSIWSLGDPRTYFINNELDNESIKNDTQDHLQTWTDGDGPYDGSQTNRHTTGQKNKGRVIWEYYEGPSWTLGNWSPYSDYWTSTNKRTLSYYYPAAEAKERESIIAPKFTVVTYHVRGAHLTRERARRRCATLQQYGYPAGRWRLPTKAEVEILRALQNRTITLDIFGATPFYCAQGSTNGSLDSNGQISVNYTNTGTEYLRCVYDSWYWEQMDADGHEGMNRIPNDGQTYTLQDGSTVTASNKELWKYFTWGDRPKENPQTRGGEGKYTVEKFLEKHKGIHPVERK